MTSIRFSSDDAMILYYIVDTGDSVTGILRFLVSGENRGGTPDYHVFVECIGKALMAGLVEVSATKITPTELLRQMVGAVNHKSGAGTFALLEFEDELCMKEWAIKNLDHYVLVEREYIRAAQAAGGLKQR